MRTEKFKKFATFVLEPIAFGLLALLFILPTITVMNLQPITKALNNINVLGVGNKAELKVNIVGGTHQIFSQEKIDEVDGQYTYKTILTRRESDRYSKPIIEIINNKAQETIVEIYGGTQLPTGSDITMIISDQVYRLQAPNGDVTSHKITLIPGQKYIIFLAVETFSDVQFEEDFQLNIKELSF
ncbi:MAG: hypothetical protein UR34_C0012G0017 [candidate division WS6 bacterium GW2011_GWC1_33_20]|uniref:Uncharacterized protein n=2 Tax=Candidatus Dojkabacteria TaxID=74243 RepID=A0A0G0AF29_9BACT|nr:MAG: hypothetical protein UR32_C0005G0029 [candidate division WS6 bacterium GW2011_GWE2_33_157]KKP43665.1 MAG: hypothetical protein UR34_C0012G0017 [candidate division WS6 bacterium GW2011_GWC1_33_20]KKP45374.1 MAG: hypothetical protein UR36_C0008G0015 [candidate division WS6 bacterium GW2011_GWF1_33_233]KKP54698.1 MAG: hypothetical protein UR45_C0010G0017 [candidate division WS6 bacterium GW2011_WS6_33_547]KKP55168.1 MAG: hypothetical protein UR47_C0004G0017 [candidate division WS6 bacteriu